MALFRRFFYRKPPEGLVEISERVFVFDCCFTPDVLEDEEYNVYIGGIVDQLYEYFPDASFMVFNFGEGDHQSKITDVLSKYEMTLINYPRQYEKFPVLTMEMINHFLISSENWLSIGQRNLLLMHCRNDALPALAFMLAAHLISMKQYSGGQKTLDMIYKQATHEILQSLSPLNPLPSQLRYLQYVSRRDRGSQWPPLDRALTLDCIVLRAIPNVDGEGGCHPIFRIYGQDPNLMAADRRTKLLISTPQKGKAVQHFKQADCEIVKIDINCHVQGDVLLEGTTLTDNLEHENVMFRVMFNTAFIQSNVLILNREEIDVLWNANVRFPKDFKAEVHFLEMNFSSSLGLGSPVILDEGLPNKASVKVQDLFSNLDLPDPTRILTINMHQQRTAHNILSEKMEITSSPCARKGKEHNGYPQSVIYEQIEKVFLQDNLDKKLESGPNQVNEDKWEIGFPQNIQKENFASDSPCGIKEGGFCEISLAMLVETQKSDAFDNDTVISALTAVSETPLAFSKSFLDKTSVTKKIEFNELQVAVQRPAQCKIISPRISKSSVSNPAVYSNSLQGSPVALSRYHGAPSVLGITALLHDHAEFSSKEITDQLTPESVISSSAPYLLKHVQPNNSSIPSAPEQPPLEKHSIKDEKGREASLPPPTPPSLLPSTRSMHPPPPLLRVSAPLTPSLSLAVSATLPPPPPPPPIQSTCQLYDSKLSGIMSSQPVSLSPLQPKLQSPPLQSSPSTPPPPPPLISRSNISTPTLPNTQSSLDSKMSKHIRPQLLMPPLPPPSPSFSASTTSLSSNRNSASISPAPSLSPCSGIASTSSMDQLQVPLPPPLPPSLTKCSEHFRNQLSAPSPFPHPHPSSITSTIPSFGNTSSASPVPPPPLPPFLGTAKSPSLSSVPLPPPLPSHSSTTVSPSPRILSSAPPPHPPSETASLPSLGNLSLASAIPPPPVVPLPVDSSSTFSRDSSMLPITLPTPPPPPCSGLATVYTGRSLASPPPPPPPLPCSVKKEASVNSHQNFPPPPAPLPNGLSKAGSVSWQSHSSAGDGIPVLPFGTKGKLQSRTSARIQAQTKKTSLKPYHWLKLTRAMQGSLWAEAQKPEEASKAPELDMSELESLFSATIPNSDPGGTIGKTNGRVSGLKSDKVHLIELRRAYNCEIMLIKFKVPLSDLTNSVLALDDSVLDIDQVDNLIKFCPTKEEIELLKNYRGNLENLGKCEQFFLELMKVPRVESKLRVISFKMQFCSQLSDLRNSLHVMNSASSEVRNSVKLKRIMQTILALGNALNHGTARGSAIGFRLDSLLKLTETRSRNNKLTLMHYLCKVLAEKLPEVLDFQKDLVNLEAATKIQLKYLAEEMQAIRKGMEKVAQELTASENDGLLSENFCMTLKNFLGFADTEVRSLVSLYSEVGKNADALAFYFGEDPARCPFEQVVSTLLNFVGMFLRAHEENCKQLEYEKKKAQKEAENEKAKLNASKNESESKNMNTSSAQNI